MEKYKSAALDLIMNQQEQKFSFQKQLMENQRRMEELHIEIHTFSVEHITIATDHPSSNGQVEHIVDTF